MHAQTYTNIIHHIHTHKHTHTHTHKTGLYETWGKEVGAGGGEKTRSGVRPVEIYMCSVAKKMGYSDGFKWLSQFLN